VRYVVGIVTEGDPDTRFWAENSGDRVIGRMSRLIFDHFGGGALDRESRVTAEGDAPSTLED
jgi:hypothetical protein